MKILFIGAATSNHTIRWVNALSERGHDVLLVSRNDQQDNRSLISKNVKVEYLKYGGGIGYYLNSFGLRKIVKRFRPDIVNAHYATGYGTLARLSKCSPLVLSVWGSDVYIFPWKSKKNKKLVCKNLSYADAIASTSYAMANETRRVLNDFEREITVTPFGVDLNLFYPNKKNIPNNNKVIGIVKYLEPIYDIPLLINAFEKVLETEKNVELHIYGDGHLKDELLKMCVDKGIEEKVKFLGVIPNTKVPEALNTMDVFVNCSKKESFGVAVVEAMACGVPVVVTDCDGYKEIVDNHVNGIIIDKRDPNLLAKEILNYLNNPDIAHRYSKNALEKVRSMYDWSKNVSIMEQLYCETAKKSRSG